MSLSWSLSSLFFRVPLSPSGFLTKLIDIRKQKSALPRNERGQVFLVGAGPGDPELLTVKALRLIQSADVVLYDWLVGQDVLSLIPSTVEQVFVGKRAGRHSVSQQKIGELLCYHASLGKRVVRLKGGDPSVFGRLGEECDVLAEADIPFAVVPGVTAASGMSAYTGIPLTDRRCSQSVRFITAQFKKPELEPDWRSMAPPAGQALKETLVFYMGLSRIALICQRLKEHGVAGDTPAMVVDQATTNEQQSVLHTLNDLPFVMQSTPFKGPALLVVGSVVGYQHCVELSLLSAREHYVSSL